jgi:glucose/arabinose dehydrogenase
VRRAPLVGALTALALAASACATDPAPETTVTIPRAPTTSTTAPSTTTTTAAPATTVERSTTTTPPPTTTTTLPPLTGLVLDPVSDALSQPVVLTAPTGDERLFVVERIGRIRIIDAEETLLSEPFLDLTDRVNSGGLETGLLGLAFHPDYAENGRLFAYYFHGGATTRLSEFAVSDDPDLADPESERILLEFDQPTSRHNAGMLQFGPDGYLYVSLGEGGAAATHAQDPNTLLSSILRLDVDSGDPYAVPSDNPFVEGGGAPEVWAYGLRNPWRFAIDPVEEVLYIADVGHSNWEEINVVPLDQGGYNFGWLRMEGTHCFRAGCDPVEEGLTLPVIEYSHDDGCSITGGFPYRGALMPELAGRYFYSDWCAGWIRSIRVDGGVVVEETLWLEDVGQVNAFGMDSDGEIYVLTWDGRVARILPTREG